MATIEIKVPDLGSYRDVPVIEVLVKPGDSVAKDQGLLTLESDKATMEVPATVAGVVRELRAGLGDRLNSGMVVAVIETATAAAAPATSGAPAPSVAPASGTAPRAASSSATAAASAAQSAVAPAVHSRAPDLHCQLAVLGAGPGGYTAAFRGADLGLDTVLIERYPQLGGVCLNVGCIPSKALLHAARVIDEAAHAEAMGIRFGKPAIALERLRAYKDQVVAQLTAGLAGMAKQRKVRRLTGRGRFVSPHEIEVEGDAGATRLRFERAIVAAGSQPVKLPGLPWGDPRLMDSTDALMLAEVPRRLLVIGGGIIGLEMACVYAALGAEVSVVELMTQLMPGADPDLVRPFEQRMRKRGAAIHLGARVMRLEAGAEGLRASFEGAEAPSPQVYDRVLCAVGRVPNGHRIGAEAAGIAVDQRGFIAVDGELRTNVPHIHAIGDIVGHPMLAHKATHEGKVAAEVCAGLKRAFDARVIPSVAYTDPEVAWVGLTETEAKARGLAVGVGRFPHAASGRALGVGRTEGFTKLLFDEATHRIVGAGIVGPNAGDLIAEAALAIELGAEATDIGLTIHPHPTLSESVGMAAEAYEGTITDLYLPKRKA